MGNLSILETGISRIEIEEMETLMKSVDPFELIQSNRALGFKRGYNYGKYNEQLFEMAIDYVRGSWKETGDIIPSMAGLARYLSVTQGTLCNWKNDISKPEFKILTECLDSEQERITLNKGGSGEMSATIAKLVLAKHGYHDKSELAGFGGGPIETRNWTTTIVDPGKIENDAGN